MKSKTPSKQESTPPPGKSLRGVAIVAAAVVVLAGIVGGALLYTTPRPVDLGDQSALLKLVETLSPSLFTGKALAAYQVAKEIPEVLVHLPCFCGCPRFGHKNNLYCFSDDHGKDCEMCMNIALKAKEMHSKGTPVEKITQAIREKWGPKESSDSH